LNTFSISEKGCRRGAPGRTTGAESIPFEPDPGNTGVGNGKPDRKCDCQKPPFPTAEGGFFFGDKVKMGGDGHEEVPIYCTDFCQPRPDRAR
jgi:hypothetical protein